MPSVLAEWLEALASQPFAAFLRESTTAYAALNATHILSIAVLVGSIATLDLRALGLFRAAPFAALAPPLSRMAALGVLLAIATGFLLFSVRPLVYAENPAFLAKLSLVVLGVVNALFLRSTRAWREAIEGAPIADAVRAAAFRSLLIWAGAIFAGRWIGFLQ